MKPAATSAGFREAQTCDSRYYEHTLTSIGHSPLLEKHGARPSGPEEEMTTWHAIMKLVSR
jgi:hypothetical protein